MSAAEEARARLSGGHRSNGMPTQREIEEAAVWATLAVAEGMERTADIAERAETPEAAQEREDADWTANAPGLLREAYTFHQRPALPPGLHKLLEQAFRAGHRAGRDRG